jgi:anti-sigma factor RsiW
MTCEYREKIALYADGELDGPEEKEVSAHMRSCADCTAAMVELMDMKKAVRIAGKRFTAPPELRASLARMSPSRAIKIPGLLWKWGLAAACLALLVASGTVMYSRLDRSDPMVAELVDQHVTTLASPNPVDIISTDRHTVKPWFQGKLPFTFNPPELAGSRFNMIGGKVVYARQSPGAELLCQTGQHRISIFVFQAHDKEEKSPRLGRNLSFTVSDWTQSGLHFYLVTDASPEEAGQLVSLFQEANKS